MILYHCTPSRNDDSIGSSGLLLRYAQGARRVWGCIGRLRGWASGHIAARHGVTRGDVTFWRVYVPDRWLTLYKDGIFFCDRDIPVTHLERVTLPVRDRRRKGG